MSQILKIDKIAATCVGSMLDDAINISSAAITD